MAGGVSPRASRKAAKRGSGGGLSRLAIALFLLGFVAVAAVVVWRRSYGVAQSRVVTSLEEEQRQLEAERARLERDIRDLSSRSRLQPVAERLGLHVPPDSMVVNIPRPSSAPR
jgi:cell division protein FtsB